MATAAGALSAGQLHRLWQLLLKGFDEVRTAPDPLVDMVAALAAQGVTPESAQACFDNNLALDKVVADVQSGQALGVTATPTLFINEQNYANPGGMDAIAAILRQVGR